MKKLRLFLVTVSLLLVADSWACGGDDDSYANCHLFVMRTPILEAIEKHNLAKQNADAETLSFWYGYTGGAISKNNLAKAIEELKYETFTDNKTQENALTAFLSRKHDKTALAYLRYNSEINYGAQTGEWTYHEPYTMTQWKSLYNRIIQLKPTTKMADRVQFLKFRCLYKMSKYKDCITLWNTKLKSLKNTALRNRIEGYIGGAYFWTGRYNEAIDIFQQYGDMQSINSAVNKMLSSTSKESLYAHDPNSIALEYAMQDYANYYYQYKSFRDDSEGSSGYFFMPAGEDVGKSVAQDYEKTMAFAERVLREGKTANPMFWAGFIGFMKWIHGDADEAYSWLTKAESMKGTSQMAYCVRTYKFLAAIKMKNKPADFDDYFLGEYKFYLDNSKNIRQSTDNNIYTDQPAEKSMAQSAFSNEITREAIKYYADKGYLTELLLNGINDRYGSYGSLHGMAEGYIRKLFKENTIDEDKKILEQYKAGGETKMEKALLSLGGSNVLSNDLLCDIIGTKLLREMKFVEAQDYLSQVSLSYLNTQGIACYLAKRRIPQTPFKRQDSEEYWDSKAKLQSNVKLRFAQTMAEKMNHINYVSGDEKARAELDFANHLFQASCAGDLWALTDYSWESGSYESSYTSSIVAYLQDAEREASTTSLKKQVWYAMMAINTDERGIGWDYSKDRWDLSNLNSWQKHAFSALASCVSTTESYYRSCDILRCYMKHYR